MKCYSADSWFDQYPYNSDSIKRTFGFNQSEFDTPPPAKHSTVPNPEILLSQQRWYKT